jgi:hypothetical protein
MPQVQEGDILLFSQSGVVRHFDSNLNFIQIKSILTQEEYPLWFDGITDDDNARMGIQVGNEIYIAMPGFQGVGILDLNLTRVDTFLNPFRGNIEDGEGVVNSIAYDSVDHILYVASEADYDIVDSHGFLLCIAAYSWPTRQLLWRIAPAYLPSAFTVESNRAFRARTAWISLSSDRTKLYLTDTGYGVGYIDLSTRELVPFHYIDAVQPTYFSDKINWDSPPSAFPDTSTLHYKPGPPHHFMALTDGTEGPVSISGSGFSVNATEGNKLNTNVFFGYFGPSNTQPDVGGAQLQLRAMSIAGATDGKVYVMVNQLNATQFRQINNYPTSPFFWAIMENRYSGEPAILVLDSNGLALNRLALPVHESETGDINQYKEGYLDLTTPSKFYSTDQPWGVAVDRANDFAYAVQITTSFSSTKGAGPLTRFDLNTGEVIYRGDRELVPDWAIQELNDGGFIEARHTTSYRHVLPVTFITTAVFQGLQRMNSDASIQWTKLDGF